MPQSFNKLSKLKMICLTNPTLNLSLPTPPNFIWNTIIRAAAIANSSISAHCPVSVYSRMLCHGVRPDLYTFPALLPSLSSQPFLTVGRSFHAHAFLTGLLSDSITCTALINMYSCCGSIDDACDLFYQNPQPDLASWNAIICGYLRAGFISAAHNLFGNMPVRNVISWSCMIDGLVKFGDYRGALELFRDMQREGEVLPNEFTLSSVLSACTRLGALEHGKRVHLYIDKLGMTVNNVLGTCLIDMYAKCGCIDRAREVFNGLSCTKDVMVWSAMMSGFAIHGHAHECHAMFSSMRESMLLPNDVTFLALLGSCVHGGLVHEGNKYFKQMKMEFGINPAIQHYGCMVELFARVGLLDEAWQMMKSMPMKPDELILGALLSGSRTHGDIEKCKLAFERLIQIEPENSAAYALLANVYAKLGQWDGVRHVRDLIGVQGIKKSPGCCHIEVEGQVHEFFVGDRSHPLTIEICLMLEELMDKLKLAGYVGDAREVLLDFEEEEQQLALSFHS